MKETHYKSYRLSDAQGQPNHVAINDDLKQMARSGYTVEHTFTFAYQNVPQLGIIFGKELEQAAKAVKVKQK